MHVLQMRERDCLTAKGRLVHVFLLTIKEEIHRRQSVDCLSRDVKGTMRN